MLLLVVLFSKQAECFFSQRSRNHIRLTKDNRIRATTSTTRRIGRRRFLFVRSPTLSALPEAASSFSRTGQNNGNQNNNNKKQRPWIDYKQLEQDIKRLGRRGETEEALNLVFRVDGGPPTVRIWNAAIDACARATRKKDAFEIFELFLNKPHKPNVFTFGALMSACARARDADGALKLLRSMKKDYGVEPNAIVYSSAISACARSQQLQSNQPPTEKQQHWQIALDLLEECTQTQFMSVVGYNAALSACAQAGQYLAAIELLTKMQEANEQQNGDSSSSSTTTSAIPPPDPISYGTVLMACERGEAWEVLLEQAKAMEQRNIPMDTLSLTSCLHACQQLGNHAKEALRFLERCKEGKGNGGGGGSSSIPNNHNNNKFPKRQTAGWERKGAPTPIRGPDPVAYRLAISACARGGDYQAGLDLLDEMHERGLELDVMACTAAVTGCEYAGEWRKAFLVLQKMMQAGVAPNEVTIAAVIAACGTACAKTNNVEERKLAKRNALQLYQMIKKKKRSNEDDNKSRSSFVVQPNTAVYSSLIRTCAEAHDMDMAFAVMTDLQQDENHDPNVFTYSSLMTACERVGSLEGVTRVFTMIREDPNGIQANEVVYGAGISTCRKNDEPDRCLLLLRRMLKEGLQPNTATVNAVLRAQRVERASNMGKARKRQRAELVTRNAVTVYKLLLTNTTDATPDRETYCILVWNMINCQQPRGAEFFIRQMSERGGYNPDVDMYTKTVALYERLGQPVKALRVMEYMESQGINFYNVPFLNAAFSKALKLVNSVVGSDNLEMKEKEAAVVSSEWNLEDGELVSAEP